MASQAVWVSADTTTGGPTKGRAHDLTRQPRFYCTKFERFRPALYQIPLSVFAVPFAVWYGIDAGARVLQGYAIVLVVDNESNADPTSWPTVAWKQRALSLSLGSSRSNTRPLCCPR